MLLKQWIVGYFSKEVFKWAFGWAPLWVEGGREEVLPQREWQQARHGEGLCLGRTWLLPCSGCVCWSWVGFHSGGQGLVAEAFDSRASQEVKHNSKQPSTKALQLGRLSVYFCISMVSLCKMNGSWTVWLLLQCHKPTCSLHCNVYIMCTM